MTYHRSVKDRKQQNWDAGEDHIVGCCTDSIHERLPTEPIVELEVEEQEAKNDVLVEGILDEPAEPVS